MVGPTGGVKKAVGPGLDFHWRIGSHLVGAYRPSGRHGNKKYPQREESIGVSHRYLYT